MIIKKYRIVSLIFLALIGVFTFQIYKQINKASIIIEDTTKEYYIVGIEYNGSVKDKAYNEAIELIEKEKTNDSLPTFMIHYQIEGPSNKNKFNVNTFIGYTAKDKNKKLKENFEYRLFRERKVVKGISVSSPIFQGKLYPEIVNYFKEKSLQIDSSYIVEKYWKENRIEIEMGIK